MINICKKGCVCFCFLYLRHGNFKSALWTFKQQLALEMSARYGSSIVLLLTSLYCGFQDIINRNTKSFFELLPLSNFSPVWPSLPDSAIRCWLEQFRLLDHLGLFFSEHPPPSERRTPLDHLKTKFDLISPVFLPNPSQNQRFASQSDSTCTYSAIHKAAGLTVPGRSMISDWYNSCGTEKCPLAVNGSCQPGTASLGAFQLLVFGNSW